MSCTRFRRHRVRCFMEPEVRQAVRLIEQRGVSYAQASKRPWCSPDAIAQLGETACGRSAACIPRPRSDEAGAIGDRAAQARGCQAEGRARHPKKAATYFAKEST